VKRYKLYVNGARLPKEVLEVYPLENRVKVRCPYCGKIYLASLTGLHQAFKTRNPSTGAPTFKKQCGCPECGKRNKKDRQHFRFNALFEKLLKGTVVAGVRILSGESYLSGSNLDVPRWRFEVECTKCGRREIISGMGLSRRQARGWTECAACHREKYRTSFIGKTFGRWKVVDVELRGKAHKAKLLTIECTECGLRRVVWANGHISRVGCPHCRKKRDVGKIFGTWKVLDVEQRGHWHRAFSLECTKCGNVETALCTGVSISKRPCPACEARSKKTQKK